MIPFTAAASPRAEARVTADLGRIVEAVRVEAALDPLLAVFLLGGYARGEGTVRIVEDGTLRGFNDYDLLLVFSVPPPRPERFAELSRRLARELEIDFVDLGVVTLRNLASAPPTLFWYELGEAHRLLWARPGERLQLPEFKVSDLDPAEGSRLLLNRGLALLWAGARLWSGPVPGSGVLCEDPAEVRFTVIAAHKAMTAVGDAALLRANAYTPSQLERQRALADRSDLFEWAGAGYLEAYARAVAFRRNPIDVAAKDAAALWWEARGHHERGFRAAEEARLGESIPDWGGYRKILRARSRRWPAGPREAARWLRRAMGGKPAGPPETRWMLGMSELLYGSLTDPETPARGAAWKERALALVSEWHS